MKSLKPFENRNRLFKVALTTLFSILPFYLSAQSSENTDPGLFARPGVIITVFLLLIPILAALVLVIYKTNGVVRSMRNVKDQNEADRFAKYLKTLNSDQIDELQKRKENLDYHLSNKELSGSLPSADKRGLLSNIQDEANIRFIAEKKKSNKPTGN